MKREQKDLFKVFFLLTELSVIKKRASFAVKYKLWYNSEEMNEKKYKRLEYLRHNIDYLSIRERQEYYELLNELKRYDGYSDDDMQEEVEADAYEDSQEHWQEPDYAYSGASKSEGGSSRRASRNHASASPSPRNTNIKLPKKPKKDKPRKKRRWLRGILAFIILIIIVMAGFFVYGYNRGVKQEGGTIKNESFTGTKNSDGSTNILVLGADKRPGQSSDVAHTDSIMVLHISKDKKTVRLVSFMRDTLVLVPGVTSDTGEPNVKINASFTIGENYNGQGINLLSDTLKKNFGINIQYYAVVDFSSFSTVIDSLFPNGVEIDAKFSTINGQTMDEVPVPDDLSETQGMASSDKVLTAEQAAELGYPDGGGTFMMIKQGKQKMDGRTLLNYARFRHDDQGDAGRVARQQQVMSTVMSQLKNPLMLFTGASALGTARAVTMTNIPNSFFLTTGVRTLFSSAGGLDSTTIPADNDWTNAYDKYGGLGLLIDMSKYRTKAQSLLGQ